MVAAVFAFVANEETMVGTEGHRVDGGYLIFDEELSDAFW